MGKQYRDFQHRFSDPGEEEKTGGSLHECDLLKKYCSIINCEDADVLYPKAEPVF
jgi:hypothetical protein